MLNDFIELFLGAYYNFIGEEYVNRDYFASIICVVVIACACAGCFGLILVITSNVFKAIRGALK